MYDTTEDAQRRLMNCIVLYRGLPHIVVNIYNRSRVIGVSLVPTTQINADAINVPLSDPELSFMKFPMGYVNTTNGDAVYITRMPIRHTQQGLHPNNVAVPRDGRGYTYQIITQQQGFTDLMTNTYPSFGDAMRKLEDPRINSVAFTRTLAVRKDNMEQIRLLYKGEDVGVCPSSREQRFKLPSRFSYLKEAIEENGVNCYYGT